MPWTTNLKYRVEFIRLVLFYEQVGYGSCFRGIRVLYLSGPRFNLRVAYGSVCSHGPEPVSFTGHVEPLFSVRSGFISRLGSGSSSLGFATVPVTTGWQSALLWKMMLLADKWNHICPEAEGTLSSYLMGVCVSVCGAGPDICCYAGYRIFGKIRMLDYIPGKIPDII